MFYLQMPPRKPGEEDEFKGATWEIWNQKAANFETMENYATVGADRNIESAVIHLALTVGEGEYKRILEKFQPNDFYSEDIRFVFQELILASEAGVPVPDTGGLIGWFKSIESTKRFEEANLDWRDSDGTPNPCALVCTLIEDSNWATAANLEFYFKRLRSLRVTRGCRSISNDLHVIVGDMPDAPQKAIEWLEARLEAIKTLAATIDTWNDEQLPKVSEEAQADPVCTAPPAGE